MFGADRVTVARRLEDAIDEATALAEAGGAVGTSIGSGAVLITGSVVTVGEARAMLPAPRQDRRWLSERSPKRGMCAAILSLEAIALGLTTPVMINLADVPLADGARRGSRALRRLPAAGRACSAGRRRTPWAG